MIQGHGGDIYNLARKLGCRAEEIIDLSSNINPLGMPPGILDDLRNQIGTVGMLPEADSRTAARQMAGLLALDANRIMAGNGTTHFIYSACPALEARKVLILGPTYADYADACRMHHIEPHHFMAHAESGFEINLEGLEEALGGMDMAFICNPNNPTGRLIPHDRLRALCQAHPGTHFVIDESYLPFVPSRQSQTMAACELDNVSVLYSLSKIFGLPGLRAGFLIANPATIARFQIFMQPWSLNSLSQVAVGYLCRNSTVVETFIDDTRSFLENERKQFRQDLGTNTQVLLYPSLASYFLIGLPIEWTACEVCKAMAQQRILIRNCSNFHGLSEQFVRVALKKATVNRLAAKHLAEIIGRRSG